MNRRNFLKLLSAVPATLLLPVPDFVLAAPGIPIADKPIMLGKVRIAWSNDIYQDRFIFRLDACNGRDQFSVDFVLGNKNSIEELKQHYRQTRDVVQSVLHDRLVAEKWMASDLIALPPLGKPLAPWMIQ